MNFYDPSLSPRFSELLAQREAELRAVLQAIGELTRQADVPAREVTDFKDAASDEAQSDLEEAQSYQAQLELAQVVAARRRLQDESYGYCLRCGKPIDLRRLAVLPATPYCVDCQGALERSAQRP